jgi:hypothetical protein
MAMEKPAVGDLISVRFQGKRYQGYVIAVESDERHFTARFFDPTINDGKGQIDLIDSGFHSIQQKGWTLHKTLQTCNG